MARKYGCLTSFLVTGIVTYGIWVFLPRSRYASEAQTVLQQAAERDQADRTQAKDTANNGYLNPTLLPLWGRKNIEFKPESEVGALFTNLTKLSDLYEYQDTNLEDAVKSGNAQVLGAFQPLEKLYPEIHKAVQARNFLVPYDEGPDLWRVEPNLLGLRRVSYALSAYAELLTLQGKSDQALAICGDLLVYARQVNQQQAGLNVMASGNYLRNIAQETSAMVLETSQPSDQALRDFTQKLEETHPDGKLIDQASENDLLLGSNTLDHINKDPNAAFLTYIPGLMSREKRMYHNDYLPTLISRQKGQEPVLPPDSQTGFNPWFFGRRSFAGNALISDSRRLERNFQLTRKRQGLIHLLVALRQQKASTLKDLKDYKPLDGFNPDDVQVEKGVVHYKLTPEENTLWGGEYKEVKGLEKWSVLNAGQKEWILR